MSSQKVRRRSVDALPLHAAPAQNLNFFASLPAFSAAFRFCCAALAATRSAGGAAEAAQMSQRAPAAAGALHRSSEFA